MELLYSGDARKKKGDDLTADVGADLVGDTERNTLREESLRAWREPLQTERTV